MPGIFLCGFFSPFLISGKIYSVLGFCCHYRTKIKTVSDSFLKKQLQVNIFTLDKKQINWPKKGKSLDFIIEHIFFYCSITDIIEQFAFSSIKKNPEKIFMQELYD